MEKFSSVLCISLCAIEAILVIFAMFYWVCDMLKEASEQVGKARLRICTPVFAIAQEDSLIVNYQDYEDEKLIRRWSQEYRYSKNFSVPAGNSTPNQKKNYTIAFELTDKVTILSDSGMRRIECMAGIKEEVQQ